MSNFFGLFYPNYCCKQEVSGQKPPAIDVIIDSRMQREEVQEPDDDSCNSGQDKPRNIERKKHSLRRFRAISDFDLVIGKGQSDEEIKPTDRYRAQEPTAIALGTGRGGKRVDKFLLDKRLLLDGGVIQGFAEIFGQEHLFGKGCRQVGSSGNGQRDAKVEPGGRSSHFSYHISERLIVNPGCVVLDIDPFVEDGIGTGGTIVEEVIVSVVSVFGLVVDKQGLHQVRRLNRIQAKNLLGDIQLPFAIFLKEMGGIDGSHLVVAFPQDEVPQEVWFTIVIDTIVEHDVLLCL